MGERRALVFPLSCSQWETSYQHSGLGDPFRAHSTLAYILTYTVLESGSVRSFGLGRAEPMEMGGSRGFCWLRAEAAKT